MFEKYNDSLLSKEYLETGYIIRNVSDNKRLALIQQNIIDVVRKILGKKIPSDYNQNILDNSHLFIKINELNDFRLQIIKEINADSEFRINYFLLAKPLLEELVSNELAMQLNINLSIQLPGDSSSLLPVHADTWSGDSPFEVVVWLPLVNCYRTKSMYIVPKKSYTTRAQNLKEHSISDSEALYKFYEPDIKWLNINYGEVLVFNQSLPHGNRINKEAETRWSMNCRFKGVFTPYGDKKNGEFFEPITLKPASIDGLSYKYPSFK